VLIPLRAGQQVAITHKPFAGLFAYEQSQTRELRLGAKDLDLRLNLESEI
jgi:hypothetical protein